MASPEPVQGTAEADATASSHPALALQFIQVAFAGHNRPGDLGDVDAVAAGLQAAFEMLAAAGLRRGRLLTGFAPGADPVAAGAWNAAGLGSVHVVYPFVDDGPLDPMSAPIGTATWLDGATTRLYGRNPHLAQTRWLIGAADLLIVVWTGRHARGAGGTADAVRLALEHGIPVLWVQPSDPHRPRLIRPEFLDEDFGFLEFLEELKFNRPPLVQDATPASLHAALSALGLADRPGPEDQTTAAGGPRDSRRRRGVPWPWRTYAVFRRALGGRPDPVKVRLPPDDLLAQDGFAGLTAALAAADDEASRLGAIHRSHQVILLAVAILAACAGSSSVLWPEGKLAMVILELMLALGALLVWLDSERGERHRRWSDARKLAEDLRLERAAWTLGVSTVPHGVHWASSNTARQARRLAGLPEGAFGPDRVAAWGDWAIDELVTGQAAYHREQSTINGRISHRVHQLENASFGVLLLLLVSYVGGALLMLALGQETPHWLGGLVVVAGAVVPAIGAAGLALEATLSLGEQARRSRILSARLTALTGHLETRPGLERFQAVAKAAIRLLRIQEDHWTEDASRRRLFRGG
jgi:hypothetical protein